MPVAASFKHYNFPFSRLLFFCSGSARYFIIYVEPLNSIALISFFLSKDLPLVNRVIVRPLRFGDLETASAAKMATKRLLLLLEATKYSSR